jgi:DNA-binding transcriptional LysR family regulator
MRIALPAHHRLARLKRIEWRDLAGEAFVLLPPDIARGFYDDFLVRCRAAGFELKVAQYATHYATQMWLISAGLGIAPMPAQSDIVNRSGITFRALPADAPVYEMALAWRRDDSSPVLQHFVKFVTAWETARH